MNIYEYAMRMEKEGEDYYRDLAKNAANTGIKRVLTMVADAETRHYDVLQKMRNCEKTQLSDSAILSNVKNVFAGMKEEKNTFGVNASQVDVYRKVLDVEKKSRDFYLEKANEVSDETQKEIFLKIADEEKQHAFIIENIIDFISHPSQWLEDAEWYHLDEY